MDVVGVNVFRTWKCWQWCLCRTKTTFPMFDDALAWDLKLFIFFVSHEKFYWTRKPSVAQERHLLTFAIHELTTTLRNIHGIRHHPLSFSSLVTGVHSQLSNPVETAARWSSREYREFQGMSYQGVWTSSYSGREQGILLKKFQRELLVSTMCNNDISRNQIGSTPKPNKCKTKILIS